MAKKDLVAARASYEKALSLQPMNAEALTGLTALDVRRRTSGGAREDRWGAREGANQSRPADPGRTHLRERRRSCSR